MFHCRSLVGWSHCIHAVVLSNAVLWTKTVSSHAATVFCDHAFVPVTTALKLTFALSLSFISRHIVEQIMGCRYDFNGRRWKRVSKQAKAFVEDLLVENPDERPTAEEASGSTWLNRRYAATTRGPTEQEMDNTTSSLTTYANYHKLKKLVRIIRLRNGLHSH